MIIKKKTVLIVDDFPLIIDRLLVLLTHLDNIESVISAGDFGQAISLLIEFKPEISILDIHLPDKSGIELLRHIKKSQPNTIVIMLTNETGEYYRKLCQSLGADYFIDKSNEFDQVPLIISTMN